jgi:hypothetical protein
VTIGNGAIASPKGNPQGAELSAASSNLATCRSLSLFESATTSPELKPLYTAIADLERAFEKNDSGLFSELVHPALSREAKAKDVFPGTVHDFGLEKAKLVRNAMYAAEFPQSLTTNIAECPQGELRGVVGPSSQFAVMHSFAGGNEQIRVFSIFAPIPASFAPKMKNAKRTHGIVMLFAQTWTHGKKAPSVLLQEARKWSVLNEPVTAWVMAEASLRLLAANPYFTPTELSEAKRVALQTKDKLPAFTNLKERIHDAGTGWNFEELAVIFQSSALEVGAKFRMKEEETVNGQLEKCKKLGTVLASEFPGLTKAFSGFECMPYAKEEGLGEPPGAGTQFHSWKSLAETGGTKL